MFCKKLCCDITIRLVTINFQICIPHSVTFCIVSIGEDGDVHGDAADDDSK
jgi:hypothetical protein